MGINTICNVGGGGGGGAKIFTLLFNYTMILDALCEEKRSRFAELALKQILCQG